MLNHIAVKKQDPLPLTYTKGHPAGRIPGLQEQHTLAYRESLTRMRRYTVSGVISSFLVYLSAC